MCRLPTSFLLKLSCEQICLCPQYSKSRQTGTGHATDLKNVLHDTVLHTDALCQISGSWPLWFPRKM